VQSQHKAETGEDPPDAEAKVMRMRRLKYLIDRERFSEQAERVIRYCAADKSRILEVSYAGDIGVGLV
jgi:hypothetical protein